MNGEQYTKRMIAVIADDFTGAAEIGGIGLRHGLKVIIETEVNQPKDIDLLVIATDTRSMTEEDAARNTILVTKKLMELGPRFIFKKIDSALRGNIASEIIAQMGAMNKQKALIIAANPIFKRIILNGQYSIDGVPLHQTNFATDPEFPVSTSSVKDIISNDKYSVFTGLTPWDYQPQNGLIAGDVRNFGDLEAWAAQTDENTIPAGSSGFFDALLTKEKNLKTKGDMELCPFGEKILFVLGSMFPKDNDYISKLSENGYYISNMPEEIYFNKNFSSEWIDFWANDIVQGIEKHQKVFASVTHTISSEPGISSRIKETLGIVIKKVLQKTTLNELIIEGGGTTSVILQHLQIKKLIPVKEIDTGIIRMKMDGLSGICLTTKPGSYSWPQMEWPTQNMNQLT
jgi:D-threonate/D-erythronate kinase